MSEMSVFEAIHGTQVESGWIVSPLCGVDEVGTIR